MNQGRLVGIISTLPKERMAAEGKSSPIPPLRLIETIGQSLLPRKDENY